MNEPVVIVEADLHDPRHAAAVVALVDAFARDPMGGGRGLEDEVRRTLVAALRQHPTTLAFLAFRGDRAVGVAVCFVGFSTFTAKPLLNVHDLAVLPNCRRQGIGRRLLERVESKARELGCSKVTLEVREDNAASRRLYQSAGFGDGDLDGRTAKKLFWTKQLE